MSTEKSAARIYLPSSVDVKEPYIPNMSRQAGGNCSACQKLLRLCEYRVRISGRSGSGIRSCYGQV